MKRARKYKSQISTRIKAGQDPLIAARNKKKLILASLIADAIEKKDIKKGLLAEQLDKYSSEVTRWTSGFHNFTVDTLSDIEEILEIQLLPSYLPEKPNTHTLACTLTVNVAATTSNKQFSKEAAASAATYIANSGGMQVTSSEII